MAEKISWAEFIQNPKGLALKKFMATILESKYYQYEDLINRASFYLVTDNDLKSFAKMVTDIYELGYMKAVSDYKEQLTKLGINVNIVKNEKMS